MINRLLVVLRRLLGLRPAPPEPKILTLVCASLSEEAHPTAAELWPLKSPTKDTFSAASVPRAHFDYYP